MSRKLTDLIPGALNTEHRVQAYVNSLGKPMNLLVSALIQVGYKQGAKDIGVALAQSLHEAIEALEYPDPAVKEVAFVKIQKILEDAQDYKESEK